MIINLAEVVKRIQALLEDPTGSFFDSGYLLSFINQCFDDIATELSSLDLEYEEVVQVLNPVTAGTTDLSGFEADGGQLASIATPISLEWKRVGEADILYKEVSPGDGRLPDVADNSEGISGYEWRGGVIYITPSAIDVVLRVRFHAISTNLVDPADKVTRGITNVLAYKTAALAAASRGSADPNYVANLEKRGQIALEDFETLAVKSRQKQEIRFGSNRARRMTRRRRVLVT